MTECVLALLMVSNNLKYVSSIVYKDLCGQTRTVSENTIVTYSLNAFYDLLLHIKKKKKTMKKPHCDKTHIRKYAQKRLKSLTSYPDEETVHHWLSKMHPVKILIRLSNAQADLNLSWEHMS